MNRPEEKLCIHCREMLPPEAFYTYASKKTGKTYVRGTCKRCAKGQARVSRAARRGITPSCPDCGRAGYRQRCPVCAAARRRRG